jgi:hypothetical protein
MSNSVNEEVARRNMWDNISTFFDELTKLVQKATEQLGRDKS